MKHLKTYRIFESNSEHDDIIGVLNDMSLELKDDGFDVHNSNLYWSGKIMTEIVKTNTDWQDARRFHFKEIRENVLQMINFMESDGWSINTIEFVDATGSHVWRSLKNLCHKIGDIESYTTENYKKSIEELNSFMAHFTIKYEKK